MLDNKRAAAILTFDKCLYLRDRLYGLQLQDCKTAFSLHVVESASDDYSF